MTYPSIKEYGVFQQIVDWNGNVLKERISEDGFLTLERAQRLANDWQKCSDEYHDNLDLPIGLSYKYVAKEIKL